MGRKNKGKKGGGSGQGASSQEALKPLSKQAKNEIMDHIKTLLESKYMYYIMLTCQCKYEPRCKKTGLQGFDQVRHKPGCIATEDG